ncbi:ABC transporter permease subunit [uncultured Desulfosarcina sp.]|uniref:ABC transporter permease n=1 Tax=uncultured Desulfosarcina sp. TaxID=218289 RepID=UPI0029C85F59|nr:ABC transporter permease subunit [uncultured Desulfosarcina sp.]
MSISPLTIKKLKRFHAIKRGYYAFVLLVAMILGCLGAELLVSNRALIVCYQDHWYFPTYGDIIPGKTFGLAYDYETNYRDLADHFQRQKTGNWVLLPPVPYSAFENDLQPDILPPEPPTFQRRHYLGTDTSGRDVLARLVYGFRIAILFSLGLLVTTYAVGISIGCAMGYFGGWFDILLQRIIEIWSTVPFLYVVIIISSIVVPNFWWLIAIMVIFGWMGVTWTIRTVTYKEKARDYVLAAKALGASDLRIIFRHILPNTVSIIVTYIPFSISGGIVALTSLDYLGFGLPPPTPSWGELLQQAWANFSAWWLGFSVIAAMVVTLVAVTFVGEAVREAFDPKMHTVYE